MANIAPILRIQGKVRQVSDPRTVPAVEAREAYRDEDGTFYAAREARPAYDCVDLVIDTDPGGLVEVVLTPPALAAMQGTMPTLGDVVDYPVRGYTNWKGNPGRRYPTNGYSLAADVFAGEQKAGSEGRRVSAVS